MVPCPVFYLLRNVFSSFLGPAGKMDSWTPSPSVVVLLSGQPTTFLSPWYTLGPIQPNNGQGNLILPLVQFFAQAVEENDLQYASAHWEGKWLWFNGSMACAIPSSQTPYDMASFLSQDMTNWPLFNSFFPPNLTIIVQALISGMGTLVSNGSQINGIVIGVGLYTRAIPHTSPWLLPCK